MLDTSLLWEDIEAGEDQVWPDWSTLKACYYQPGHAQVMCFLEEGGLVDGKSFRRCPRTRLQELVSEAKTKHDLKLLVGLKVEFYILESKDGNPMQTTKNVYSTASLRNSCLPILEEIVSSIQQAGLGVRQFHSEGNSGCFEFSLEPLEPLQAADALVYCHEAIKTICVKHGRYATMHPKPFEKLGCIGSHIHLSISQADKEDFFLSGLLESWTALAAFYNPNFDSHTRVKTSRSLYVYYGTQNKAAPIRKVSSGHWELRTVDATMNPYLTLLAILTAGLLGIENEMELIVKDMDKLILSIDEKMAEEKGIKDKLPTSLTEALEALKSNQRLRDALGPEIVERYLKVKTKEEEIFSRLTWSERRDITMRIF